VTVREVVDPRFLQERLRVIEQAAASRRGGNHVPPEVYRAAHEELSHAIANQHPGAHAHFVSRTHSVSTLQSFLSTCIESRADKLLDDADHGLRRLFHNVLGDLELFREFGRCDPLFLETKLAEGIALFEGRPPFPDSPAPPAPLGENARIVVVGDWGTGLPGAVAVGRQMRGWLDRAGGGDTHVLHLGDVYYSGWREEYEQRFLPYWPVDAGDERTLSWALNGNHDAYSGGHGYFGFLLRDERFRGHRLPESKGQVSSSYFSIENEHWQILGLDTAYEDHDLAGGQAAWVAEKLASHGGQTMLLTHHQPFSAFEDVDPKLLGKLQPALDKHPLAAWLWGHEHRCHVYGGGQPPYLRFASCIGHGGVPQLQPDPPPEGYEVTWRFEGSEDIEGNRWLINGFAVLDFKGPELQITYVDERGNTNNVEKLPRHDAALERK
jgi:hypothetical protein